MRLKGDYSFSVVQCTQERTPRRLPPLPSKEANTCILHTLITLLWHILGNSALNLAEVLLVPFFFSSFSILSPLKVNFTKLGIIKRVCLILWVQVYAMRKCLNLGTVLAKYYFLV